MTRFAFILAIIPASIQYVPPVPPTLDERIAACEKRIEADGKLVFAARVAWIKANRRGDE